MCSFIILLLLLCKNGGNCGCNCGFEAGDYARGSDNSCDMDYGRRDTYDRSRDDGCDYDKDDYRNKDDYRRNNDDYRRSSERDCGCSACEESASDASPIKEREDIWTPYKNPSSGRQNK